MFNRDLVVPALIGLGLYAQNSEVNLANNTSILLILFLLLQGGNLGGLFGGGYDLGELEYRRLARERRFGGYGCPYFNDCCRCF